MKIILILSIIFLVTVVVIIIDTNNAYAETIKIKMARNSYLSSCQDTNQCFVPTAKWIKVDDVVRWYNEDIMNHNVRSGKGTESNVGNIFNSGEIKPNKYFEITFTEKGTYYFHCMYYPWMKGQVNVRGNDTAPGDYNLESKTITSVNKNMEYDYAGVFVAIAFLILVFLIILLPIIFIIHKYKKRKKKRKHGNTDEKKKREEYEYSKKQYNDNYKQQEEKRQRWKNEQHNKQHNEQKEEKQYGESNKNEFSIAESLDILESENNATREEIKKKHRSALQKSHAEKMMSNINNAYEILKKANCV